MPYSYAFRRYSVWVILAVVTGLLGFGCSKAESPAAANGGTYYQGPMQSKAKPEAE